MKIHLEFNNTAEMVAYSKFILESATPQPLKDAQTYMKSAEHYMTKSAKLESENKRLNELLDRAYLRLKKADPAGVTANMKFEAEVAEDEFFNWAVGALSTRSYNCLQAENIKTFKDLCSKTQNDLLKIPNLGRGSIREIVQALKEIKKSLKK